ncbi:MAG: hypothetical protein AAGU16_06410 [Desulfitobacterium hafniense]
MDKGSSIIIWAIFLKGKEPLVSEYAVGTASTKQTKVEMLAVFRLNFTANLTSSEKKASPRYGKPLIRIDKIAAEIKATTLSVTAAVKTSNRLYRESFFFMATS